MLIDTRFEPKQRVRILALDPTTPIKGRIMEISIDASGVQYRVVYYTDGCERQTYFWEDELESDET